MRNYFKFQKDIEVIGYSSIDPSRNLTVKAYGGTSCFDISGWADQINININDLMLVAPGKYKISISKDLTSSGDDKLFLKWSDEIIAQWGESLISSTPIEKTFKNWTIIGLRFELESGGHYVYQGTSIGGYSLNIIPIEFKERTIIRGDTTGRGRIDFDDLMNLDLYVVKVLQDDGNFRKYDFNNDLEVNVRDAAALDATLEGLIFSYNPIDIGE